MLDKHTGASAANPSRISLTSFTIGNSSKHLQMYCTAEKVEKRKNSRLK
jgi:hypothetical protein